jgi:uncharacterized protein YqeY
MAGIRVGVRSGPLPSSSPRPAALHRLAETVAHIAEALWMQALDDRLKMSNDPPTPPSTADPVESLRARLSADLLTAMKARDKPTIDTLRCLLAVLDNAGAQDPATAPSVVVGLSADVPRKSLTQSELDALMKAEVTSRSTAAIEYERGGRHQDAARLRAELVLLSRYIAS